jgi:cell shape-determining protein MreC
VILNKVLIIIFLILGAIFLDSSFSVSSLSIVSQVKSSFSVPFLFFKNMFLSADLTDLLVKANLENKSLRADIVRLSLGIKPDTGRTISAKVYASYPFNDKSLIVLARGISDGIIVGDVVLASRNIFLGQVISVGDSWSEVRTIFDISKSIPVRIGAYGVSGLLVGGATPLISMIDKTREINIHDSVYIASRGLPYGLVIGEVGSINDQGAGAFKSADLLLDYSLQALEEVLVSLSK